MQFFGQVLVEVAADQAEKSASAKGSIVIPFPTGQGGSVGRDAALGENTGDLTDNPSEVTVDVELPVIWTEDGKVAAYVTYEFNDSEILIHHPVETWGSGKHILSLYYPIDNLVPNITNTFNVYLRMEGGMGKIDTGGCIASVSGQAMAAAAAWDGKINIEETVSGFVLGGGLRGRACQEAVKTETMELVQRSYTDRVAGRTALGAFCRPVETTQEGL